VDAGVDDERIRLVADDVAAGVVDEDHLAVAEETGGADPGVEVGQGRGRGGAEEAIGRRIVQADHAVAHERRAGGGDDQVRRRGGEYAADIDVSLQGHGRLADRRVRDG
jgi:hypothetical protein